MVIDIACHKSKLSPCTKGTLKKALCHLYLSEVTFIKFEWD